MESLIMESPPAALSLLTFAPMIDSECCRFILNHYKIAYRETAHLFGWASVLALIHGGTGQIPLLRGGGLNLAGPRALADGLDPSRAGDLRLIPADGLSASQVDADWSRFNGTLADATAVLGYYYLLPRRAIMIEPFSRGIPPVEARILQAIYPAFAGLFKVLLRLNPAHAKESLEQTRAIFDETDRRLADGRWYLVGDRLTLSDIALATAAAPVLLPENYGAPMPPLSEMPAELQAIILEMRQRKTARFVERIFRDHRSG